MRQAPAGLSCLSGSFGPPGELADEVTAGAPFAAAAARLTNCKMLVQSEVLDNENTNENMPARLADSTGCSSVVYASRGPSYF